MMDNWTESASRYLEEVLKSLRSRKGYEAEDSLEFAEDIKLHVETEISTLGLDLVTEDHVRSVVLKVLGGDPLEKIDDRHDESEAGRTKGAESELSIEHSIERKGKLGFSILAFGVVLPIVTLLFELFTKTCANLYFNPIPSIWHAALIALVPAIILWNVIRLARAEEPSDRSFVSMGVVVVIALAYSIPFIPLIVVFSIGILYFGLGLLPLAPLLSLFVSFFLIRRLVRARREGVKNWIPVCIGLALGIVLMGLVEAPRGLTSYGMKRAASLDAEEAVSGVRFLRRFGSEKYLFEKCLPEFSNRNRIEIWANSVGPESSRRIYYRVTGRTYQEALREKDGFRKGFFDVGLGLAGRWDRDLGDQVVGRPAEGVRLDTSRMDGIVEANAVQGYVEWTMEFVNESRIQAEARGIVELPSGGVVSRATLWVDGEEREAAFAARKKAVAAYKSVVRRRRDPLLVTSKGVDRALLQCFPIPPNGGKMKIRLGITYPLELQNRSSGVFNLPRLGARNFETGERQRIPIWFQSKTPLRSQALGFSEEDRELKTTVTLGDLDHSSKTIWARRDEKIVDFWSTNPFQSGIVLGKLIEGNFSGEADPLVVVLDGSEALGKHRKNIERAFADSGASVKAFVVAGDEVGVFRDMPISEVDWNPRGGQDNAKALLTALELLDEFDGHSILWIHGSQEILISSSTEIERQLERKPRKVRMHALQVGSGSSLLLHLLERSLELKVVPRHMDTREADLSDFLKGESWRGETFGVGLERDLDESEGGGYRARDLSARLWAFREAKRLYYGKGVDTHNESASVSASYQLVTPSSGAVVLENARQYEQAGLEPGKVKGPSVSIPDTGSTLVLLAVGLVGLAALRHRRTEAIQKAIRL